MNGFYVEPDEVLNDTLEDEGADECEEVAPMVFRNVRCADYFNGAQSYLFPYVVLTKGAVFPFVEISVCGKVIEPFELLESVEYRLKMFLNQFRVLRSPEYVFVLVSNTGRFSGVTGHESEKRLFMYQPSVDGSEKIREARRSDVVDTINASSATGAGDMFDETEFHELALRLSKAGSEASEGTATYFAQEPEKVFYLALFGGVFGAHRYYLRMYGSGLLYTLTLGLLGVGWFFDCLEMVLGVFKKKGKKLKRLPRAKKHFVELIVALVVLVAVLLFLPIF